MKKLFLLTWILFLLTVSSPACAEVFTVVFLTDTHISTGDDRLSPQTQWIVDNKISHNIKFVMHGGDFILGGDADGDLTYLELSATAMDILAGQVPYLPIAGNHDYQGTPSQYGPDRLATNYNIAYPLSDFSGYDWFGGSTGTMRNSYGTFTVDGTDYLVMGLEFCPDDSTITWADGILSANTDKKIILFTHAYFQSYGSGVVQVDDEYTCWEGAQCGQQMYDNLISKYNNIFLVLSGHSWDVDNNGYAMAVNVVDGLPINQVRRNYQASGDNTYISIFTINTATGRIEVESYSPSLGIYNLNSTYHFYLSMTDDITDQSISCSGVSISGFDVN